MRSVDDLTRLRASGALFRGSAVTSAWLDVSLAESMEVEGIDPVSVVDDASFGDAEGISILERVDDCPSEDASQVRRTVAGLSLDGELER